MLLWGGGVVPVWWTGSHQCAKCSVERMGQHAVANANQHIEDVTMHDLVQYMSDQHAANPTAAPPVSSETRTATSTSSNRQRNDANANRDDRGGRRNRTHRNTHRGGRGNGNRNRTSGRGNGNDASGQYYCRVHGANTTHDWRDCRANPDGPNYDPTFVPRVPGRQRQFPQARGRGRYGRNGDRGGRGSHSQGQGRGSYHIQSQYEGPQFQPSAPPASYHVDPSQAPIPPPPAYPPPTNHWLHTPNPRDRQDL